MMKRSRRAIQRSLRILLDLMVTDRWQHELWHICDLTQRAAPGRARELAAQWSRLMHFWWTRDWGIGTTEAGLPRVWFW